MSKLAYIAARKQQELELFKKVIEVDKVFVDIVDRGGRTTSKGLEDLLETLKEKDTLFLKSFTNVHSSLLEIGSFIRSLKEKDIKVNFVDADKDEEFLLTETGISVMSLLIDWQDITKTNKIVRDRKSTFPENFLTVNYRFNAKELTAGEAAVELGIPVYKFYDLYGKFN